MSSHTPHKPHGPHSLETTTRLNVNDTYGEEEITLVEEEPPVSQALLESEDDGDSVTLRMREVLRRAAPRGDGQNRRVAIENRLRAIEKRAAQNISIGHHVFSALSGTKNLAMLLVQALRQRIKKISWRQILKSKRAVGIGLGLVIIVVLLFILGLTCGHSSQNKTIYNADALDTSGLRVLDLSALSFKDPRGAVLNPQALVAGQPFFVHFDVLEWNEQPGKQLELVVDLRVYAQAGKIELYKPALVKYGQVTDMSQDKVHVKIRFDFTKEAPPDDYRLSFAVREQATQKVAFVESKVTINN